jgi:hypothetical protein
MERHDQISGSLGWLCGNHSEGFDFQGLIVVPPLCHVRARVLVERARGWRVLRIDTFWGLPEIIQIFINEPMVLGTGYAHWALVPFGA